MLYDLAIAIYDILVHLAAPFSRKPRKMMKGHWVVYELLRQQLEKDVRYIWFHAASLGEYEQGLPVIEGIKAKYPSHKIIISFFSPSGYEVRKNNIVAHATVYLPLDTKSNAKEFIKAICFDKSSKVYLQLMDGSIGLKIHPFRYLNVCSSFFNFF